MSSLGKFPLFTSLTSLIGNGHGLHGYISEGTLMRVQVQTNNGYMRRLKMNELLKAGGN